MALERPYLVLHDIAQMKYIARIFGVPLYLIDREGAGHKHYALHRGRGRRAPSQRRKRDYFRDLPKPVKGLLNGAASL